MKHLNNLQSVMIASVLLIGTSVAAGAGISSIGALSVGVDGTPGSAVNAISPDGQYAVGYSNGTVTISNSNGSTTDYTGQIPVIWTAGTLTQLPLTVDITGATRGVNTIATGVVVRPTAGEIGIGGGFYQTGYPNLMQMVYYTAPLSNLGSGAWHDNSSAPPEQGIVGPYNTSRLRWNNTNEQWFIAGDRSGGERDFVQGVAGGPSLDHRVGPYGSPDCISNSVNGMGNTAGSDNGNPGYKRRALFMNNNNGTTQTIIPGGRGVESIAYGISANPSKVILSGYDKDADGNSQAFIWKPGDDAMTLLGTLDGDTQSTGIAVNLIGGKYITGGFSSDGTNERAVIWDTTGAWDTTGQPRSVLSLLSNAGFDVSAWTSLSRVTTMSDDGMTLGGYGIWAADGSTRGFVATIPEPVSLWLLALSGLIALSQRRR